MKKFSNSLLSVLCLCSVLFIFACKSPSGGGSTASNDICDYIRNMTKSGTAKVTGEINSDTITAIKSALSDLRGRDNSILVALDLSETTGLTSLPSMSTCYNLSEIYIPDSVTNIEKGVFPMGNLEKIYVAENNQNYKSIDGVLFSKDGKTLIRYPAKFVNNYEECINYVVPDSVNVIEEEAFDSCVQIKDVKISSNVTSIGRKAFARCSNLRMIDMPDSVKTIGDECFFDCVNLYDIKRLGSITELGRHTFYKCGCDVQDVDNLNETVVIPDIVTSIGERVFELSVVGTIVIPTSVTSIGSCAFSRCGYLKTIKFKGTESQWNAIQKGEGWNEFCPTDMQIIFNYTGE